MPEFERKTILLVEDEVLIAKAESMMLERHGYSVRAAYSGEAAIEAAGSPAVDLVLMDIDLGRGIDGTEAAERILAARSLPVLFLSSHTERDIVERTQGITSYGYVVKNSGETVLLASIAMAFRLFEARQQNQRKAEELEAANARLRESLLRNEVVAGALKEREAELRGLFDAMPAGVCMLRSRIFREVNAEFRALFGYSEDELVGRSTRVLYFDDEEYERVGRELYGALAGRRRSLLEARVRRKDGSAFEVLIGASAVDPAAADPMSNVACVLLDVTERKRAQDSLRTKDKLLAEIFRACPECLSLTTLDEGRFVEANDAACRQLAYSREELIGHTVGELGIWSEAEDRDAAVGRLRAGEMILNLETRHRRKDGGEFDAMMSMAAIEIDGISYVIGFVLDVSGRKRMEGALKASLREKDLLLHELQHRIKNNLAMIAGLVGLEMDRADGDRQRGILGDLKDRILSLSSLYELLLRSGAADSVDLGEYLESIVSALAETYAIEGRPIRVDRDLGAMRVDIKGAISWGLIVNELTTNALKYAFASAEAGVIRVRLSSSGGVVELVVSDDGVGLPRGFDLEASGGLGLGIVRMMAAQLGGRLSVAEGKGAAFVVRAPDPSAR
jgi:two-component system, sensor histidine kinase PdtaS